MLWQISHAGKMFWRVSWPHAVGWGIRRECPLLKPRMHSGGHEGEDFAGTKVDLSGVTDFHLDGGATPQISEVDMEGTVITAFSGEVTARPLNRVMVYDYFFKYRILSL